MIKKIKNFLLFFGFLTAHTLTPFAGPGAGSFGGAGAGAGDAMFQMPTPEEMAQIEEFLNTLSPEEIDQLAQLGEQIIKEAEAEGRPLFPDMPIPITPVKEPAKSEQKVEPVKNTTDQVKAEDKVKTQQAIKSIILSLIETLSALRHKASLDEQYSKILHPVHNDLDLFVYYLHVIKDSKHLKNITEEEFAALKDVLLHLEEKLNPIVENLHIPSIISSANMDKSQRETRRKKIRRAEEKFQQAVEILNEIFTTKEIIKECEKLLKKYEPQALKIKDEQTKKSQLAGSQSSRLGVTNTGKITQPQSFNAKTAHYAPVSRGSSVGTTIASSYDQDRNYGSANFSGHNNNDNKPNSGRAAQRPGARKADGSSQEIETGDSSANEKSSDENIKTRGKIKKSQEKMVEKLKAANQIISSSLPVINDFKQYVRTQHKDPEIEQRMHETFEKINFELKHAQKAYNECFTKSENLGQIEHKKTVEACKKSYETQTHALNDFTTSIANLYEGEYVDEKLDEFAPEIGEFQKYLDRLPKMEKVITKLKKTPAKRSDPKQPKETASTSSDQRFTLPIPPQKLSNVLTQQDSVQEAETDIFNHENSEDSAYDEEEDEEMLAPSAPSSF